MNKFHCSGKVFKWTSTAPGSWYFVRIDKATMSVIKETFGKKTGWGIIPVSVTLGKTTWETSIFPDKNGTYLLPLKAEVRKKEHLTDKSQIDFQIQIR